MADATERQIQTAEILMQRGRDLLERRRDLETLEWKMNFSLWGAIAVSGWAVHSSSAGIGRLAHVYWGIIFLHGLAVYRFWMAEKTHISLALDYVRKGEEILDCKVQPEKVKFRLGLVPFVEVVTTIILSAVAFTLAW